MLRNNSWLFVTVLDTPGVDYKNMIKIKISQLAYLKILSDNYRYMSGSSGPARSSKGTRCWMGRRSSVVFSLLLVKHCILAALTAPSLPRTSSVTLANFQNARGLLSFLSKTMSPTCMISFDGRWRNTEVSLKLIRYSFFQEFVNCSKRRLWYWALLVKDLWVLTVSNCLSLGSEAIRLPYIKWEGVRGYETPSSSS